MNIYEKVASSLRDDFTSFCCAITEELEPLCDSPIEVMLGAAILVGLNLQHGFRPDVFVELTTNDDQLPSHASAISLIPQYRWSKYKIDFAILFHQMPDRTVFIECDGHDFHERTKDQAAHDRSRDRAIQEAGIPILRFTGSEINRSPGHCAFSILTFIQKHTSRANR